MKKYISHLSIIFLAIVLSGGITSKALALSYTGSLTGAGGGITATSDWISADTIFSWEVEWKGSFWEYEYTFTVPKKDISHFIIEVSEGSFAVDFSSGTFDWYDSTSQGNSNPGMPGGMQGLKFEPGALTLKVEFTTTRAPVWGDFYAKSGKSGGVEVTAWNTGFLVADPSADPANGSINYHILRPDTKTTSIPQIPEPTTMLLLGLGLIGVVGIGRKYKK